MLFLFGLASDGVYIAVLVTKHAVRSYRTLSPLPTNRRSTLCCTFRWLAPPGHYPASCFPEARTFLTLNKEPAIARFPNAVLSIL